MTYKQKLEKNWKVICQAIDNNHLPSPYNIDDFKYDTKALETALDQLKSVNSWPLHLKKDYLHAICVCELMHPNQSNLDTWLLVEYVVLDEKDMFMDEVADTTALAKFNLQDWWTILRNIWAAMAYLDKDFVIVDEHLIATIHAVLMKDLTRTRGQYRTRDVVATGSPVTYLPHAKIKPRMIVFMSFFKNAFENLSNFNKTLKVLCLAGFLFSEFLLIHPFFDGNGRAARLLLSIVLKQYTIVPISLFFKEDKDLYFEMLEKRDHGVQIPWSVIRYTISSALETVKKATHVSADF